jgi:hypothetical protein
MARWGEGDALWQDPACSEGRGFSHGHDAPYPLRRDSPGPSFCLAAGRGAQSFPPPALGERRHRGLARRLVRRGPWRLACSLLY